MSGVCVCVEGGGGEAGVGDGEGVLIDFMWPQPLPLVLPWYTHLFSPPEGFLTHQCNISENIKIKRIQR